MRSDKGYSFDITNEENIPLSTPSIYARAMRGWGGGGLGGVGVSGGSGSGGFRWDLVAGWVWGGLISLLGV